jgi:hypothetical protein
MKKLLVPIGYCVYILAVIIVLGWFSGTRSKVKAGGGVQIQTLDTLFLFVVSLIFVAILDWSPLNLLWMFPVSWICGFLSLHFPFSILQPLGNMVGIIACIGLNRAEVAKNRRRVEKYEKLVFLEHMSVEDAKKKMEENGEL